MSYRGTTTAIHARYGYCEVLSHDELYCLIKMGQAVRRVQTRLLSQFRKTTTRLYPKTMELRKYAKEIGRLKNEIHNSLSEPNRIKWVAMNSQQKKIAVFRAMELGFISWTVGSTVKN